MGKGLLRVDEKRRKKGEEKATDAKGIVFLANRRAGTCRAGKEGTIL